MFNEEAMLKLEEDICLRGYSDKTCSSYIQEVSVFLQYFNKPVGELGEPEVREFILHLKNERRITNGSINCYISALRFFFDITLDRPLNPRQIPRLKYNRAIPQLLTKNEIRSLFDHTHNLMYKAMFMTIYGSGLRIREAINLKVSDIDSGQMRIFIRNGKGGRDRFAALSYTALESLRIYWKTCRPRNDLFLTVHKMKPTAHTVNNVFQKALAGAGISKYATLHTLRHCYATHLLEDGVNLFQIKKLLGHSSIRSTAWYLHFADTAASEVTSPLDSMDGSGND